MYLEAIKRGGVAVVTGAANGVGKVAATRFAEAGLSVVIADLDAAALVTAEADVRAAAPPNSDATIEITMMAGIAG